MRAARGRRRSPPRWRSLKASRRPAGAWESEILPARVADYETAWLDDECLAGRIAWARLRPRVAPAANVGARGVGPVRATPIALFARRHAPLWRALSAPAEPPALGRDAQTVAEFIRDNGASFFDEMAAGAGLLRTQIEEALSELVALGLATSDSFAGLRALLVPSEQRKLIAGGRRRRRTVAYRGGGRRTLVADTARRRRARERRRDRTRRANVAQPLRRRVLAVAGARGRLVAALARSAAGLPSLGGARRNPRRPLRRRLLRRAIRASPRRSACCARRGETRAPAKWSRSPAPTPESDGHPDPGPSSCPWRAIAFSIATVFRSRLSGGEARFHPDLELDLQWERKRRWRAVRRAWFRRAPRRPSPAAWLR